MFKNGFSKILIIIVVLVVVAGSVLAWRFWPRNNKDLGQEVEKLDNLQVVESCLEDFLITDEQIKEKDYVDIDGDGYKEIVILTFNENPPRKIDCFGYCDEAYVLRVIGITGPSNKCQELYYWFHTKKEGGAKNLRVVDLNEDGKEEILIDSWFVRTTGTYLIALVKDEIKEFGIYRVGVVDGDRLRTVWMPIGFGADAWDEGCEQILYEWNGSEIIKVKEETREICL